MVRYEYVCPKCGEKFLSKVMKGAQCPACKVKGTRVFSIGMVQFKGKGFYATGG
jgi:putative FmdB family regulatory protein